MRKEAVPFVESLGIPKPRKKAEWTYVLKEMGTFLAAKNFIAHPGYGVASGAHPRQQGGAAFPGDQCLEEKFKNGGLHVQILPRLLGGSRLLQITGWHRTCLQLVLFHQ